MGRFLWYERHQEEHVLLSFTLYAVIASLKIR